MHSWICIVIAHWNNSSQVDMLLHSEGYIILVPSRLCSFCFIRRSRKYQFYGVFFAWPNWALTINIHFSTWQSIHSFIGLSYSHVYHVVLVNKHEYISWRLFQCLLNYIACWFDVKHQSVNHLLSEGLWVFPSWIVLFLPPIKLTVVI